jgi:hypothetical protein
MAGQRSNPGEAGSPQKPKAVRNRPLQRVRAIGPVLAWLAAVGCGWHVAQQADLLSAALRGAAAWAGFMGLWLAGVALCESLVLSGRPAMPPAPNDGES